MQSDAELIQAAQRGVVGAFETLYDRHKEWVAALAQRFTGSREDALDILQETFAYFFRKLPGFELRSKFRTFLYPVVKHLALNRRAAARRQPPADPDPSYDPTPGHAEDILAPLPEEQRDVVWLRFVDELDLKEIAEVLGIPEGTVKSRLHAALKALRERGEL